MISEEISPEVIETFQKAIDMLGGFAKENGVTMMGNAVILKRLEDEKFGGTFVRNFTFNHPINDPKK